jgi:hypothetical protein
MNIEWIFVSLIYAFGVPIAYVGWVVWRKHFPKYIILHDLYRDKMPREGLEQDDSDDDDDVFQLPRAA